MLDQYGSSTVDRPQAFILEAEEFGVPDQPFRVSTTVVSLLGGREPFLVAPFANRVFGLADDDATSAVEYQSLIAFSRRSDSSMTSMRESRSTSSVNGSFIVVAPRAFSWPGDGVLGHGVLKFAATIPQ